MVTILLLAAAAAASPTAEAQRLGRELADHGTLAALLPLMKAKEVDELLAEHKELSAGDQTRLRRTADRVFDSGRDRLLAATGRAYAQKLTLSDLRRLVAFYRTSAAARFQAALPQVIVATMQSVGQMDFKADVIAAYCKESGKLCAK